MGAFSITRDTTAQRFPLVRIFDDRIVSRGEAKKVPFPPAYATGPLQLVSRDYATGEESTEGSQAGGEPLVAGAGG